MGIVYHTSYRCPECTLEWRVEDSDIVDGECPICGVRGVEPIAWEMIDEGEESEDIAEGC